MGDPPPTLLGPRGGHRDHGGSELTEEASKNLPEHPPPPLSVARPLGAGTRKQGSEPLSGGSGKGGGQPLPGARTHFLLYHMRLGRRPRRAGPAPSTLPSASLHRKVGATWAGCLPPAGWTRKALTAAKPTLCFWTK